MEEHTTDSGAATSSTSAQTPSHRFVSLNLIIVHSVPWGVLHLRGVSIDAEGAAHTRLDQPLGHVSHMSFVEQTLRVTVTATPDASTVGRSFTISLASAAKDKSHSRFAEWADRQIKSWREVKLPTFSRSNQSFRNAPGIDAINALCVGKLRSAMRGAANTTVNSTAPTSPHAASSAASTAAASSTPAASVAASSTPADPVAARSATLEALDALVRSTAPLRARIREAAAVGGNDTPTPMHIEQEPETDSVEPASTKRRSRSKSKTRTDDDDEKDEPAPSSSDRRANKRSRKQGSSIENCIVIESSDDEEVDEAANSPVAADAAAAAAAAAPAVAASASSAAAAAVQAAFDIDAPRVSKLDEELNHYSAERIVLRTAQEALRKLQAEHTQLQTSYGATLSRLDRRVLDSEDVQDRLAGELQQEQTRRARETAVHEKALTLLQTELDSARSLARRYQDELASLQQSSRENQLAHNQLMRRTQADLDVAQNEARTTKQALVDLQASHAEELSRQQSQFSTKSARTASTAHAIAELWRHIQSCSQALNAPRGAAAAAAASSSSVAAILPAAPTVPPVWSDAATTDPSFSLCARLWNEVSGWHAAAASGLTLQSKLDGVARAHTSARERFVEHREILKAQVVKLENQIAESTKEDAERCEAFKAQIAQLEAQIAAVTAESLEQRSQAEAQVATDRQTHRNVQDELRSQIAALHAELSSTREQGSQQLYAAAAAASASQAASDHAQSLLVRVKSEMFDTGERALCATQLARKSQAQLVQETARLHASDAKVAALTSANESLTECAKEAAASFECKVCMNAQPRVLFIPCNHLTCCEGCAATVSTCPICRQRPKMRLTVFVP